MNYFWVFQNKTYQEELTGNYLWAPKKDAGGKSVHHWTRMSEVKAGDIIFSCVNRNIVSINVATKDSYSHNRPSEMDKLELWKEEGWKVDVIYNELDKPISIDDNLKGIMSFETEKYFPIAKTGRGNQGYLFPLQKNLGEYLISLAENIDNDTDQILETSQEKYVSSMSIDQIEEKAKKSKGRPKRKGSTVRNYERNPYVIEYAKRRANGICELCNQEAPFKNKDGEPHLEVHHIKWLSKKGEDSIENTAALCPNCHRKMHILNLDEDVKYLEKIEKYIGL